MGPIAPGSPKHRSGGRLVRDGIVYAFGTTLQRGLSFLLLPAATRILGPDEFGVASAGLAVANLLAMVFSVGMNFAIVRLYYDEPEDAERTEWAMLLRVQLGLAASLAALTWLLGPLWSRMFEDVGWGRALQLSVVYGAAMATQSTTTSILRAGRRPLAFTATSLLQIGSGAALALVLADRYGAPGFLGGLALGSGLSLLLGLALTWRPPKWSRTAVRAGLALAAPFVAHQLSQWVFNLSDRVLVERFLGLSALAAYHVAYAVGSAPMLLLDATQAAWGPHYYGSLSKEEKRTLPPGVILPVTLLVTGLTGGLMLVAPALGALVAPGDYDFPLGVVALVASAAFVRTPYMLGFTVLADAKRSGSIARASSAAALFNVALNLVLIPPFGVVAAAGTTLGAFAIMSVAVLRRAEGVLGAPLHLGSLFAVWTGGTVAMALIGALPVSAPGVAARVVIALALGWLVWTTARAVRHRYSRIVASGPAVPEIGIAYGPGGIA